MKKNSVNRIITKYLHGKATPAEKQWIEKTFLNYFDKNGDIPSEGDLSRIGKEMDDYLTAEINKQDKHNIRLLVRLTAAAAAIAAIYFMFPLLFATKQMNPSTQKERLISTDFLPGGNKAVLMLSNGKSIQLSEAHTGIVVDKGSLTYSDGSEVLPGNPDIGQYTLTTPRGGQYQTTLPDGSRVWLNAASTLKYPSEFDRDSRVVVLEGEAYFDIKHDKQHPFIVITKNQSIRVLGTSFNVNSYADEAGTTTSLISGKLQVSLASGSDNKNSLILKPGEAALQSDGKLTKQPADISSAIAWKEGNFKFDNAQLGDIMRQIARWYDFEIDYSQLPNVTFSAEVPRSAKLSTLINLIESSTDIQFIFHGGSLGKERRLEIKDK